MSAEEPPTIDNEIGRRRRAKVSLKRTESADEDGDDDHPDPGDPPVEAEETTTPKEEPKDPKDSKDGKGKVRVSDQVRAIRSQEDDSLKEVLDSLGTDGAFRIVVTRKEPEEFRDPVSGRMVKTSGQLKTYTQRIDEEFIGARHGGGKYHLRFLKKTASGSFEFFTQRTVEVAGDPRLDDVNRIVPPAAGAAPAPAAPANGENPSIVSQALGMMRDVMTERDRKPEPAPRGIDPAMQMVVDQMRAETAARAEEIKELRKELSAARRPEVDPFKDMMLSNMIKGESAQVEALKLRYESEARMVKQSFIDDEKRLHDRHDRDVASIKASYEREISAIRASHEVSAASAKQSHEVQMMVMKNDINRLERDNTDLRDQVRTLRERKDKTIVEQAKDLAAIKDALLDGTEGERSGIDRLLEAAPAAAEFARGIFGRGDPGAPQQAAPAHPVAIGTRIVRQPRTGQVYKQTVDAQGNVLAAVPVKRKPKVIPPTLNADGTVATPAIELPVVSAESVALLVGYLERAFDANQDPEVVAQSGRTSVPDEILTWIKQNDTEAVSGVDLFMSKVAQLPNTSPLTTQRGRNWLRKVGKALLGE